jgi:hypothetical protein
MLDYQRIVDDVRSALFNNGQDGDDFLQGAAADYSLAIDEANERLRQCGALLRKGLRSEAIQLCEVEPNLLDVVEILDFPERDTWKELLALHGLSAPAALMLEVAANLNEGYAVEQPLATLLQRHRLLAMSHGPIRLRVETLRSLAEADPENPIWDQDLRTFEQERLKELQQEVPQAIAGRDMTVLNALAAELEHSAWRIGRPDSLISQIAVVRLNAARQEGLGQLRQTAGRLHAVHAAMDVDGGRRVRAQWDPLFATWGRFAESSLRQEVAAALDWLREEDELAEQAARHEGAVAAMEQAIMARRGAEELHRLHREARREGDIPASAEAGYRERLAAIDRAAKWRTRASLAIFASFIVAIGSVIAVMVLQHVQAGRADRALASLRQLVQDNNVDEARNFIDQLAAESPQIAADPRIQEISSRLTKQLQDEDARRRAFAVAIDLVQKSIADQPPDKEALSRAKKLAITEEENAAVRKAEQDIAELGRAVQSKVDQDFLAQRKDLNDRAGAIEKDIEADPDASHRKLTDLSAELTRLQESSPQISDAARKPAELLQTRVKALDEEAHTVTDRLIREEAITAASGDNAAFRQKLLDYADKFPQARRSASFRAVAGEESPLWDWIAQWNEAVQAIGRQNSAKFNRKTAADLAPKLRKLLDDRPGHPDADAFQQRLPYLEAIVHRSDGEGNPIEAALKPIFTDPLVAGVWMLADTAGQKYYLLEDPTTKFGGPLIALQPSTVYSFEYVAGFDLSKKRKSLRGNDIKPSGPVAPQLATAKALVAILDGMTDDQWEKSFCRMIEAVLNDHDTDPLLKHFLLRKILSVGCQGSLCLQKGLAGHAELLTNSTIPPSVNWVDPNNSEAAGLRPVAEGELGKLPSFSDAKNDVANQWHSLGRAIGTEWVCVGWLRKNMDGNWQCLTKSNCPESGKLVTVRTADADGRRAKAAVFAAVGRLDRGKAVIDAVPGPALAEGRPVYVANPPPK